jgi:RNA polymerase sigma-70 factor, ECF subfamily
LFDSQLKIALKNGQPEAFREVFRLLYPRLKGYCRLFVHNESEVEDIIQESFMALWEKRNTIDPEKSVESFLFVILRNRCLNYLKEIKFMEVTVNSVKIEIEELQYLYQLDFTEKEEKSLEEQLIVSFHEAVESLPPKMKVVFIKCKVEKQKQKEVADELGITIKAVEKHIAAAKLHISKKLYRLYPTLTILIAILLE